MEIFVRKSRQDGRVLAVETQARYKNKTIQELEVALEDYNKTSKDDFYEIVVLEDDMKDVILFLLGEDVYKTTHEIGNLWRIHKDITERIDDIHDSLDDLYEMLGSLKSDIQHITE